MPHDSVQQAIARGALGRLSPLVPPRGDNNSNIQCALSDMEIAQIKTTLQAILIQLPAGGGGFQDRVFPLTEVDLRMTVAALSEFVRVPAEP